MEFDLLFRCLYGITNTDFCAEGFFAADEFRIVQSDPLLLKYPFNYLFPNTNLILTSTCRQINTLPLFSNLGHISS